MERPSRKDIQKRAGSKFGIQCTVEGREKKTGSRQTKRGEWGASTESARGGAYLEGVDTVMNCL